ncbi:unnamed protein product, partial [Didymodactylos carnosus]
MNISVCSLQPVYTVQHPCNVKNSERAIETLGGQSRIIDVFQHSTSQLTCSFTPTNIYERSLRSERRKITGLLIRVKRKKSKKSITSVEVVGVLDTKFTFDTLADFQYLPMTRKQQTADDSAPEYESFLKRITLTRQCLEKENLEKPCPLMCIPAIFSRFFEPTDYAFRPEPKTRRRIITTTNKYPNHANKSDDMATKSDKEKDDTVASKLTKPIARTSCAHHVYFDTEQVPTASKSISAPYTKAEHNTIERLRRLFDQRPIWTRASLLYNLRVTEVVLKRIIHHVAYFCCNGPWNRCWVKYGYDPRTDSKSKIYQIVDYRVRSILDPEKKVVQSRTNRAYHRSSLIPNHILRSFTQNSREYLEETFVFKRTSLPLARSIHYQLCDIQLDDVQKMIHSNDGQ